MYGTRTRNTRQRRAGSRSSFAAKGYTFSTKPGTGTWTPSRPGGAATWGTGIPALRRRSARKRGRWSTASWGAFPTRGRKSLPTPSRDSCPTADATFFSGVTAPAPSRQPSRSPSSSGTTRAARAKPGLPACTTRITATRSAPSRWGTWTPFIARSATWSSPFTRRNHPAAHSAGTTSHPLRATWNAWGPWKTSWTGTATSWPRLSSNPSARAPAACACIPPGTCAAWGNAAGNTRSC